MSVFALIDCDAFYAACERVFRADLQGHPIVVLSNNDGCIVSLSVEAKKLSLKRGMPFFECREVIEKHQVAVFSSNYSLYQSLSDRVMRLVAASARRFEWYSIDEGFADLSHVPREQLTEYATRLRSTILRHTGIVVSIGIAATKGLCKIAVEQVKHDEQYGGVLSLVNAPEQRIDTLLAQTALKDVWGVGRQTTKKLFSQAHIVSAKDLKDLDEHRARRLGGVQLQRIVLELRGISCIPLDTHPKPKQSILSSLSFRSLITTRSEIEEAIAYHATHAAEKLRKQHSEAAFVSVFIHTDFFRRDLPQDARSASARLPFPTAFTPTLIVQAQTLVRSIYRHGFAYKKCGVFLSHFAPETVLQGDLFGQFSFEIHDRQQRLMTIVDEINLIWGKGTLFFGAQGVYHEKPPAWQMRQQHLSRRVTTQWKELLRVT